MTGGPVIAIVGPTASGKTDLAIRVAQKVDGEVICADSRTVYKGMDIGTAKPSRDEMEGVPHFGLDLVEPGEQFTAAKFQRYAKARMQEIWSRDRVPIIVGGTGLYVDSVLFDYEFGQDYDPQLREKLDSMTVESLQEYCVNHSIELPVNLQNKRHMIRAIELRGINRKRYDAIPDNYYVVGISTDREVLRKRIEARVHKIFTHNVVKEATELADRYGWESEAMTGIVYRIIRRVVTKELSLAEAMQQMVRSDMGLAKRQMTWFRRNSSIYWSEDRAELEEKCITFVREFRG